MQRRPRSKLWLVWLAIASLLVIGGFAYRTVPRRDFAPESKELAVPAGWLDLGSCAFTRSFDGKRLLTLSEDQSAELQEPQPEQKKEGNTRFRKGEWSYDEQSKRYAITMNDQTSKYSLLSQEGIETCILVNGNLETANLRESWFSTAEDPSDFDDRSDYSEGHEPH